jgi:predicted nucleotidyltransferase
MTQTTTSDATGSDWTDNGLPADFSPIAVAEIRRRLDAVRAGGPNVLFAIESGSRAWGFPSPDSDYDCRFVFVRPAIQHLVLQQHRDVIEFPIVDEVDAGGWDLRKALLLALGGNAVVVEWCNSPLVYEETTGFRSRFRELLTTIVDPAKVARHYLGLAHTQLHRMGNLDGEINLKKLFYVIRPIIALEWMHQRSFAALPPMALPCSLSQCALPPDLTGAIRDMIASKAVTREMGSGQAPAIISRHLLDRFEYFEGALPKSTITPARVNEHRAIADAFYSEHAQAA